MTGSLRLILVQLSLLITSFKSPDCDLSWLSTSINSLYISIRLVSQCCCGIVGIPSMLCSSFLIEPSRSVCCEYRKLSSWSNWSCSLLRRSTSPLKSTIFFVLPRINNNFRMSIMYKFKNHLFAILYHQFIQGIQLGGLIQKVLFLRIQITHPLIDIVLQDLECQR